MYENNITNTVLQEQVRGCARAIFDSHDRIVAIPVLSRNDADLIVESVNGYTFAIDRLREELDVVRGSRDRVDSLFYAQTAEIGKLHDIIKRLITVRENVFWRKDEKTGLLFEERRIDEEYARKAVADARAAIGEAGHA